MVDTDGLAYYYIPVGQTQGQWFYEDAVLYDSGVRDRRGRKYFVAVRVIDAGGLLNANLHYGPPDSGAQIKAGQVMPVTDVSLKRLLVDCEAAKASDTADLIQQYRAGLSGHNLADYWRYYALSPLNPGDAAGGPPAAQPYLPFDMSDMLALAWGETMPSAARGRLYQALTVNEDQMTPEMLRGYFSWARRRLTTYSASRIVIPRPPLTERQVRFDLGRCLDQGQSEINEDLITTLYRMISLCTPGESNATRSTMALQMAVNIKDYIDGDDPDPTKDMITARTVPATGQTVYGIERQPFITEAAYSIKDVSGTVEEYYAVELFNPYVTDINTVDWELEIGGTTLKFNEDPVNLTSFPAGARYVFFNQSGVELANDEYNREIPQLDLKSDEGVRILRPAENDEMILVGKVTKEDFQKHPDDAFSEVTPGSGKSEFECIRRCDKPTYGCYTLALYNKGIGQDITQAGQSNLGADDPSIAPSDVKQNPEDPDPKPTPVYVRNNSFTNVAELMRIFYVGPTTDEPLDQRLVDDPYIRGPGDICNGRVDFTFVPPGGYGQAQVPDIPSGCMLTDYFTVHSPYADGYDNDGDEPSPSDGSRIDANDPDETIVYGWLNVNTASEAALGCLPGLAGLDDTARRSILQEIVGYRDKMFYYHPSTGQATRSAAIANQITSYGITGMPFELGGLRDGPGFASPGEIALPILVGGQGPTVPAAFKLPQNTYFSNNLSPYNYCAAEVDGGGDPVTTHDDGLSTLDAELVEDDLAKYLVYYSWMSNHVTVRSDVYIAYIRVDLREEIDDPSLAVRKYVAVIDRSQCRAKGDRPRVLMFAAIQ